MSGILRLESLTKGNTLKQGDKTPLKYRLFDADGEQLNIAGKTAKVRLVCPDFLTIGYEKNGLTVSQDDTVTFTIDGVIPSRIYHVEIIVDDKFIFPSRADEAKFTVDKSSLGTETNIIEIVGKDILIREVKSQVDTELQPLVTSLESAQEAETQRASNESVRVSAEAQRKTDHANRSAEFDGKADKVVIKNRVTNGDFSDGITGWDDFERATLEVVENELKVTSDVEVDNSYVRYQFYGGNNNVYYATAKARTDSTQNEVTLENFNVGSKIVPLNEKGSIRIKIISGSVLVPFIIRQRHSSQEPGTMFIDYIMVLNLTDIFGAGNEPTKEEMDRLIEITGYIDGEYALNNKEMLGHLMRGIHEKANKKQEDWITPTLLSGVTAKEGFPVGYMKDEMGFVHFRGKLIMPSYGRLTFNLPVGYRPSSTTDFLCYVNLNKLGKVLIQNAGGVYPSFPYDDNSEYDLSSITFKADR